MTLGDLIMSLVLIGLACIAGASVRAYEERQTRERRRDYR